MGITVKKTTDPADGLAAMRLLGCAPWELIDNETEEHLRDRSEGVRIAYVAATRARDILVVPTVGDGPIEGWTQTGQFCMSGSRQKVYFEARSNRAAQTAKFAATVLLPSPLEQLMTPMD